MKNLKNVCALALLSLFTLTSNAQMNKVKKAANKAESKVEMSKTIVGVAASNKNFTTLVAAVKAAGLVDTLNSEGPFTVFAPTNDAFAKLPKETVPTLLKPESKEALTSILTYHVVAGKLEASAVIDAIKENNGSFEVTTVQGQTLTLSLQGDSVVLTDANGNTSTVVMADVGASNGVIHAIDSVVMPKK